MHQIFLIALICCAFYSKSAQAIESTNAIDFIEQYGYPAETHTVETEDHYILTLHRIPNGKVASNSTERVPVLLMHGLGASSANFVDMEPAKAIGYILADAGYDVWLGNARGNGYSVGNTQINETANASLFYDFSWHEVGHYDMPAIIDYILTTTNQSSLHYIGHSQGGTIFYVLGATRPEYNQKIRLASLMGPAGILKNTPDPLIKLLGQNADLLTLLVDLLQLHRIPQWGIDLVKIVGVAACSDGEHDELCRLIFNLVGGFDDSEQLDTSILPTVFKTIPSNLALKQLLHYAQGIKSGVFSEYDFGLIGNLAKYGTASPPLYNISEITAPVALYYGSNDKFISTIDIDSIAAELPNVVNKYLIPYSKINHGDFLYATDRVEFIYNEILETMGKY